MLPKKRRIPREEIKNVLSFGKRYNSPHLLGYVYKNGLAYSKFSFSVSKKVCKTAVLRNTYRRRGYSILNKNQSLIKRGYSCLFVYKKGSDTIGFDTIERELMELLSNSGVLL